MPFQTMVEPIPKKYDLDENYASELLVSLKLMHQNINKSLIESKEKNEKYRDKIANNIPYEIGQLVLLYTPTTKMGTSPKLTKQNRGPYRIIDKFGQHNFQIRHCGNLDDIQKVHAERLKPYHDRQPFIAPDLEEYVEIKVLFESSSEDEEDDENVEQIYNPITKLPEPVIPDLEENSNVKKVKGVIIEKTKGSKEISKKELTVHKPVRKVKPGLKKNVDFDLTLNETIEFVNENK